MAVTVHPATPGEVPVVPSEHRPPQGTPQPRRPAEPPPVLAAPGPPPPTRTPANPENPAAARKGAAQDKAAPRQTSGRPGYFPSGFAWLMVGISRSWRGVLGALVGTWFYLPLAIFMALLSAVVLGVVGLVGGTAAGLRWVPTVVGQVPLLSDALDTVLPGTGGAIGAVVGFLSGLVLGFLGTLVFFWWVGFSDDPVAGAGSMLGLVTFGLLVGLLYTLYRITFEPAILRRAGIRRMSRRERDLIVPIMRSCAQRLGLTDHPPILIDDRDEPVATAYTRHIVISRGLLSEFGYDPEVIAGVLSHEIVHWRNGDPIGAAFVRGVALPLYLIYLGLRWITRRAEHRIGFAFALAPLIMLAWALFWPVAATIRWVIVPLHAREIRTAELRADQGAVRAGHRVGLRRVLDGLPGSFETGRSGWEQLVSDRHPPNELRLEALEDEAGSYPFPGRAPAGSRRGKDDQGTA